MFWFKGNTMLFVILMTVLLIGGMGGMTGVAQAEEKKLSAFAEIGYPIESETSDKSIDLRINTNYTVQAGMAYKVTDNINAMLGFKGTEDVSHEYTFKAEYRISSTPLYGFLKHERYDGKSGLPNNKQTSAGVGARY